MKENNIKPIKNEIRPSWDNFKSAIMFFILTIGVTYLVNYQTVNMLKKCKKKEMSCQVLNTTAKIVPTLFATIAIFFLELCIICDLLRLRGLIRSLAFILVFASLPFIYMMLNPIIQNLNLFG